MISTGIDQTAIAIAYGGNAIAINTAITINVIEINVNQPGAFDFRGPGQHGLHLGLGHFDR